jgi:hypothetical protein
MACLTGCAVEPVAPNTPDITLDAPCKRTFDNAIGNVVFPKGVYHPAFQTDRGVYYEAPTSLTVSGSVVARGGLFVPREHSAKQACWIQSMQGHRYTFSDPVRLR